MELQLSPRRQPPPPIGLHEWLKDDVGEHLHGDGHVLDAVHESGEQESGQDEWTLHRHEIATFRINPVHGKQSHRYAQITDTGRFPPLPSFRDPARPFRSYS